MGKYIKYIPTLRTPTLPTSISGQRVSHYQNEWYNIGQILKGKGGELQALYLKNMGLKNAGLNCSRTAPASQKNNYVNEKEKYSGEGIVLIKMLQYLPGRIPKN